MMVLRFAFLRLFINGPLPVDLRLCTDHKERTSKLATWRSPGMTIGNAANSHRAHYAWSTFSSPILPTEPLQIWDDTSRRLVAKLASRRCQLSSGTVTANKRRHHISHRGSTLAAAAAAAAAAAGVLVCLCCYRCNIHSCLKSLTLAREQLAAHKHNTSQLVNVSVCSTRGRWLEGVLIHRLITGSGGHGYLRTA